MPRGVGGMSSESSAPLAIGNSFSPKKQSKEIKDGRIVRFRDMMWQVSGSVTDRFLELPFTFDITDQAATGSSSVACLIRQEASLFARYQVLAASAEWQPECSSTTLGGVGVAILPGEQQIPASGREMSLFKDSAYGNVWKPKRTGVWRPRESRLYNTQRGGPENGPSDQPYPFKVCCAITGTQDPTLGDVTPTIGTVYLDVTIKFIDPTPPLSSSIQLAIDLSLPGAASTTQDGHALSFNKIYQMVGDWNFTTQGTTVIPWNPNPSTTDGTDNVGTFGRVDNAQMVRVEKGSYIFSLRLPMAATSVGETKASDSWFNVPALSTKPPSNATGDVQVWLLGAALNDKKIIRTLRYKAFSSTLAADYNVVGTFGVNEPTCILVLVETVPSERTYTNTVLFGLQKYA